MAIEKTAKSGEKYCCEICNYKCKCNSDYEKHLLTGKHKRLTTNGNNSIEIVKAHECCCGKIYKHNSGLSRHKTECTSQEIKNEIPIVEKTHDSDCESLIMLLINDNNEFRAIMKHLSDVMAMQSDVMLQQNRDNFDIIKELLPK
jgi:hypothetical protein